MFHPTYFRHSTTGPRTSVAVLACLLAGMSMAFCRGEQPGLLTQKDRVLFPIGSYELPKDDEALRRMAEAGFNLVRCQSKADLDRVAAVGLLGWAPVPLELGDQEQLRQRILDLKDHPALAVWEGPDEAVHNFTRFSGLYRTLKVHKTRDAWRRQTPEAVAYAREQAAVIIPGLRAGAKLIRELDGAGRPIWMNEAASSDLKYVRDYLDSVDLIGCDSYPVRDGHAGEEVSIGPLTERWKQVGRGRKPVWMVLQAFSWSELGGSEQAATTLYPSFSQSRLMAYQVIVHGGKGVLYWGSQYLKSDDFRQSLYALTSELSALQPFLIAADVAGIRATCIENEYRPTDAGVRVAVRRVDDQWLLILVNEDPRTHFGVEVTGLGALDGRRLELLYGDESVDVHQGEIVARLQPLEVQVFATDRKWETPKRQGRDYQCPQPEAPTANSGS